MRVLDRRHLDVGILIDDAGTDVMAVKDIGHRPLLALGPADFSVRREIVHRALDEGLDAAAVNIDRLGALIFPFGHQERRQPRSVIAVRMGDEDFSDFAEIVAGLHDAARHAVAGIDQIERAVDHQQVRRLRAVLGGQRTAARAEGDESRRGFGVGRNRALRSDQIAGRGERQSGGNQR